MEEHVWHSLAYVLPGTIAAALALHGGAMLTAQLARLAQLAADQGSAVPPIVWLYFRATARVLKLAALAFLAGAASDFVLSRFSSDVLPVRILGYGSAAFLLVASVLGLLQSVADYRLRLHHAAWRAAYFCGGFVGVLAAAWGLSLLVVQGRVWS